MLHHAALTAKAVYLSNVLRDFEGVFESQVFGLKEEDWNMWNIVREEVWLLADRESYIIFIRRSIYSMKHH